MSDDRLPREALRAVARPKTSRRDELLEQYQRLHAQNRSYGRSSELQCGFVQATLDDLPLVRSILDYGCGKSRLVDWLARLNGAQGYRYDPAIPEYAELPVNKVDLVINTDVLEHIDEGDLNDVLLEIRRLSSNVYFNIATAPARAILPNGENAHVCVRTAEWWGELLGRHFETVRPVPAWRAHRCSFVTWPRRSGAGVAAKQESRVGRKEPAVDLLEPDMALPGALDALFGPHAKPDSQAMISTVVQYSGAKPARGYKRDIGEHLRTMASGAAGRPFILFYHMGLIVHIRRDIEAELNWVRFDRLWRGHTDLLLKRLNSRWLTAACDTIVDCSDDPTERSAALAGTVLSGIVKLYETERRASGQTSTNYEPVQKALLYDGLHGFSIGNGDMVKNLVHRINRPASPNAVAVRILQVLLQRARDNDTVLKRFAAVHKNDATRW